MLHWFALNWYDLHCDMSEDWSGEVSWFVLPLSLSQLCQPDQKKNNFLKNYNQVRSTGFPKQKTNFLSPRLLLSSLITKCVVVTLTL